MPDDPPALLVEPNTEPITELFAFISVDERGNEGIIAGFLDAHWMPMVFNRAKLIPAAEAVVRRTLPQMPKHLTIKLVRFARAEDMKVVK